MVAVYDGTYFQVLTALSALEVTSAHVTENLRTGGVQYAADTGAADVYAIAPSPAFTAYAAGLALGFWKDKAQLQAQWTIDKRWEPKVDEVTRQKWYSGWKKAVEKSLGWELES